MEHDFWHKRWSRKEIGFNQSDYHPYLTEHFPSLKVPQKKRVLIPLCGKSCDMCWFINSGYQVVGVELSQTAIQEFFAEQEIDMRMEERSLSCYIGQGVEVYCGDFFSVCQDDLGEIAAVYDRAALEALPPEMRVRYSHRILSLVDPGTPILTVVHEYDQQEMNGPPFSVSGEDMARLHKGCQSLEMLESSDTLHQETKLRERGLTSLREVAWKTIR